MSNLIQCPDCNTEASKDAIRCPKCGGKLPAYKKRSRRIIGWVISILIILLVGFSLKWLNDDMRRIVKMGDETESLYRKMDIERNQEKLEHLTRDYRAGKINASIYRKKAVQLNETIIKLKYGY